MSASPRPRRRRRSPRPCRWCCGVEVAPCPDCGRSRASLCRAHGRGDQQHRGCSRRFRHRTGAAGRHRQRQGHLLLVCTGERGLSGAFNSSIVRLARERALSLMGQGKEVKFFCVGRKGYDQLRRQFEKQIVGNVELRSVKVLGFKNAKTSPRKSSRCSRRLSSTSVRCSIRASSR